MAKQSNLDPIKQQIDQQRLNRLMERYFPGDGLDDLSETELEELWNIYRISEGLEQKQVKSPREKKGEHGNVEIHERKRKEVLGAALYVLANYSDECRRGENFNANAIAGIIFNRSYKWWPDRKDPPLSIDYMSRLISRCLNLEEKKDVK